MRLDTFRSVMQQLKDWTEVDVDFLLPLIYNCCFFIKNVSSREGLRTLLVKVFMLLSSPPLASSASHICDSCLFSCVDTDLIVSLAAEFIYGLFVFFILDLFVFFILGLFVFFILRSVLAVECSGAGRHFSHQCCRRTVIIYSVFVEKILGISMCLQPVL